MPCTPIFDHAPSHSVSVNRVQEVVDVIESQLKPHLILIFTRSQPHIQKVKNIMKKNDSIIQL